MRGIGADFMSDDDAIIPIDPDLAPSDPGEPVIGRSRRSPTQRFGRVEPGVLAVIAVGGMLGATARFKLAEALPSSPGHFPWATFWTNLSGSFLLGFLLIVLLERFPPTRYVRPFIATGILGAFTTMSTYTVETALLMKDDHVATAILYGVSSIAAGVFLAYAGIAIARLSVVRMPQQ
jgi:CrcB protein